MTMTQKMPARILANRLHHTAYVTKDLEATRAFYEDMLGFPLMATYCEKDELFGKERIYCHVFFELADGSALAFFQFADPDDQAEFGPEMPESPFTHVALDVDADAQAEIERRIAAAGFAEPDTYVLEHGYCRSVYIKDPNGMLLEFTHDDPRAAPLDAERRASAHGELKRWLAGQYHNNNPFRAEHAA
ncbi:MAG: VOC family protein [Alphaproteobacteria bacterium HGW-Alphaproteobacteria-7]|jgi:catechol 2,3-dioxygenase-like lactoylglutathione lyase family enzyme|nr:MAG: VOC family protein [Alphaproteobacteria bacterium HGW-Alphaproteobacteria-7]